MHPTEPSGLRWIKASGSQGIGACVELASVGDLIALRDSKNPGVQLHLTHQEIIVFLDGAKKGEFDHLVER